MGKHGLELEKRKLLCVAFVNDKPGRSRIGDRPAEKNKLHHLHNDEAAIDHASVKYILFHELGNISTCDTMP